MVLPAFQLVPLWGLSTNVLKAVESVAVESHNEHIITSPSCLHGFIFVCRRNTAKIMKLTCYATIQNGWQVTPTVILLLLQFFISPYGYQAINLHIWPSFTLSPKCETITPLQACRLSLNQTKQSLEMNQSTYNAIIYCVIIRTGLLISVKLHSSPSPAGREHVQSDRTGDRMEPCSSIKVSFLWVIACPKLAESRPLLFLLPLPP